MRILKWVIIVLAVVVVIGQFIRPNMTNPPVDQTLTLQAHAPVPPDVDHNLHRACYDCHSYQTNWRFWTKVFPATWLVANDTNGGRQQLNFSEFGGYTKVKQARKLGALCEEVKSKDMPLWYYLPLHPEAKLSDADRQGICTWATQLKSNLVATMTPAEKAQMNKRRAPAPKT